MADRPPNLPTVTPGGDLMPHMSARYRRQMMDSLFEASGGFDRALAHIEKNDDNYQKFLDAYWKGQARPISVEHTAGSDLSDLIKRLDQEDRMTNATVIDGTVTEISDAVEEVAE